MDISPPHVPNNTVYRRIRFRDIATRAGVSINTVSRVLNNKTEHVSSEAAQRVLKAASELTQQDNPQKPAALEHIAIFSSSKLIGPDNDFFHGGIIRGVQDECQRLGIHLTLMTIPPGREGSDFTREKVRQSNIQGILFLSEDSHTLIEHVMNHNIPIGLINAIHFGLNVDTVVPANREGSMLAMQYLLNKGHRRIVCITCSQRETLRIRHNTYRDMLAYSGIPYDPALVIESSNLSPHHANTAMLKYIDNAPPAFTAVYCVNDLAALGVVQALRTKGYRVPEDVSVIGFDDMPMIAFADPPITTIRVECEEMGTRAVQELLTRAVYPNRIPIRIEIACKFIERQSVTDLSINTVQNEPAPNNE